MRGVIPSEPGWYWMRGSVLLDGARERDDIDQPVRVERNGRGQTIVIISHPNAIGYDARGEFVPLVGSRAKAADAVPNELRLLRRFVRDVDRVFGGVYRERSSWAMAGDLLEDVERFVNEAADLGCLLKAPNLTAAADVVRALMEPPRRLQFKRAEELSVAMADVREAHRERMREAAAGRLPQSPEAWEWPNVQTSGVLRELQAARQEEERAQRERVLADERAKEKALAARLKRPALWYQCSWDEGESA